MKRLLDGEETGDPVRVLMLGWEFPPFISGGLGTACHGLTRALARRDMEILFVLPTALGAEAGALPAAWPAEESAISRQPHGAITFKAVPSAITSPYVCTGAPARRQATARLPCQGSSCRCGRSSVPACRAPPGRASSGRRGRPCGVCTRRTPCSTHRRPRPLWASGPPPGRNATERRASLERTNAEADLWDTGKAAIAGDVSDAPSESAGAVAAGYRRERAARGTGDCLAVRLRGGQEGPVAEFASRACRPGQRPGSNACLYPHFGW